MRDSCCCNVSFGRYHPRPDGSSVARGDEGDHTPGDGDNGDGDRARPAKCPRLEASVDPLSDESDAIVGGTACDGRDWARDKSVKWHLDQLTALFEGTVFVRVGLRSLDAALADAEATAAPTATSAKQSTTAPLHAAGRTPPALLLLEGDGLEEGDIYCASCGTCCIGSPRLGGNSSADECLVRTQLKWIARDLDSALGMHLRRPCRVGLTPCIRASGAGGGGRDDLLLFRHTFELTLPPHVACGSEAAASGADEGCTRCWVMEALVERPPYT